MTSASNPPVLRSELFGEFSETELNSLQEVLEYRVYRSGESILEEGAMDEDIYLLKSGVVEVLKFTGTDHLVVDEMSGNTYFGDQAFLDGSPRSATIRAKVDTELFVLTKKAVLEHPDSKELLNKLYRNIAMINSVRLKHAASNYAVTMEKEINLLKDKNYFEHFFVIILVTFAITQVITSLMYSYFQHVNVFSLSFTWLFLIILVGPFIYFVAKSGEPWSAFGVTLVNWKRSVIEGILISLVLIGVVLQGILTLSKMGYLPLESLTLYDFIKGLDWKSPLYFFHSYGQEFVARGVFQTAFQRFFNDQRGLRSVFITATLFGLSHLLYGPELVLASLISGVFFGLVYLRHKNLLGATIVHFALGALAFSVPSLPFQGKL